MSASPPTPARRSVRLRSLVVKLAVIAALMMLVFGWLRSTLTVWAFNLFAIPAQANAPDDEAHDALVAVMRDRNAAQDPAIAARLDAYFAALRTREELAFVLDLNGRIVARSPELRGIDDATLTAASRYRLMVGDELVGVVYSYVRPEHDDRTLLGFVTSMLYDLDLERLDTEIMRPDGTRERPFDNAPLLRFPAGTELRLDEELLAAEQARRTHYSRISNGVIIGIATITALLLGVCVSLLVTRRLRRLAREVEQGVQQDLPGPFTASGRDEISLLAGALNDMRVRITGLVDSLREQDQARREWIAQVSHDIRTPLTSLSVCLDRARNAAEQGDTERCEQALQLARHDLRRVRSFVDDLFEIARLETGGELDVEPIPPMELIADATRSLEPQADERGIALRIEANGKVPEVAADGHRLLRACENLLSNAIRYAHRAVRIGAEAIPGGIRLYVADDGDGFPGGPGRVDLDQVRGRAQKADSSGLGLLVVRRVAEAHGGTLIAENDVDGWTLVELQIPRTC